jgi:dTDP-glucose 4,6-dehydratase
MKKILITGGAGFIGSNFVRLISEERPDWRIMVLDKLTYAGRMENLEGVDPTRLQFLQGDICDPHIVSQAMDGCQMVFNFAAESVAPDTFIPIQWGHGVKLVTIEELFEIYAKKRGVTINSAGVGMVEPRLPLFALAFTNGMGQWRRVTHITRHAYQGKMVTLRQKWGSVTVTPNHSVYNANAELTAAETNPELLPVRKMNIDRSRFRDSLQLCLPHSTVEEDKIFARSSNGKRKTGPIYVCRSLQGENLMALMRFLGAYVAEGNVCFNKANGGYTLCIANSDLAFLEQLQRDAALFTNAAGHITRRAKPGVHQLTFSSRALYSLVSTLCGTHSYLKQVPDELYTLKKCYQNAFLESYLFGDGNTQNYKSVSTRRLTTNSPKLAAGLGLLLTMMGHDYSVGYRCFSKENWRDIYTINIVNSYDSRVEKSYSESDFEGYVYDLTVEGAHNFAAGIGNIVVHNTHVDRSLIEGAQHAGSFIQTNTYGVYVLLEEAQKRGVEKFLHVSTDEVYGDVPRGHSVESDTLLPRSPYAASKAGGELIARSYFVSHGVPVVITRGSNNFGPYQFPEKLIPLFITNALDDLPLPLYGDGLQQRDFLFVGDHCRGILLCAERGQPGEAYNIGGDNEHTNREITSLILELLHKDESLIRYVEDRPGHDRRYSLNCDKIHALGWHPQMTFEDAFRTTVAWYRKHEDWWRSIKNGADYQAYYQKNYGGRAGFNEGLDAVK